ncbi:MAG: hypothetical protein C4293_18000, partial [Nitrospiraceae bacterium]
DSGPSMPSAASAKSNRSVSADPYQECLARIPKDATPGQRAIAEQSCARDFAARSNDVRPVAAGTQGDNLQSCLSRIPKDASPGQRMIAEESCKRDEAARRGIEAVPGR